MKRVLMILAIAGLAGAASADNVVAEGHLSPGVAISHGFSANTGDLITFSIWDFTPLDDGDNDSFGGVKRPDNSIAETDDDDGPGFLSILHRTSDATGGWTGVVTGFGDSDLNGSGHSEDFDYRAVMSTVDTHAETEGNNGIGSANSIFAANIARISGSLVPDDVDYYAITLASSTLITAETADGAQGLLDTMVAIFDGGGNQLGFDDDDAVGLNSGLHAILDAGTYYVAVTGFNDLEFDGFGHSQSGSYKLVLTGIAIPAPSGLALLGLGGLVAARRRR